VELQGKHIFLRRLTPADASDRYVSWLNDPEVNQYIESRFCPQTRESVAEFIRGVSNASNYLFGIFDGATCEHIGNIKIGNINPNHRFADVGLLIGEKSHWGKGLASEAIRLVTEFGFKNINLNKLVAGMYDLNSGSYRAFIACGYREVGRHRQHFALGNGKYVDSILVEKLRGD